MPKLPQDLGQWNSEQKYSLSDRCRLKLKNIKIKCSLDVNFCCLLTKMISATGMGQKIRLNDFNFQFTKLPHIGFSKNRFLKAPFHNSKKLDIYNWYKGIDHYPVGLMKHHIKIIGHYWELQKRKYTKNLTKLPHTTVTILTRNYNCTCDYVAISD